MSAYRGDFVEVEGDIEVFLHACTGFIAAGGIVGARDISPLRGLDVVGEGGSLIVLFRLDEEAVVVAYHR